jgi:hypothetical protein
MSLFSAIPIATIPSGLLSDHGFENTLPINAQVSLGSTLRRAREESSGMSAGTNEESRRTVES